MRRLAAFLPLLVAALYSVATPAAAAERVALVIGNGAYQATGQLPNPGRDAEAMAAALEALGFQVILRTDADRRGTDAAIGEFINAASGAGVGLFFFAGHGIQIGGDNLLLPVDVSADSEWSLRSSAIEAQRIVSEMEKNAGVSIVILDACRDNPIADIVAKTSSTRSVGVQRGLGRMRTEGRGAIIAFAAAAGDTAADGAGEHSPFTAALLEEIDEPNVEVGLMFRRVARRVREETGGDQYPELLVRLVDEVYMNPVAEVAAATAQEPAGEPAKPAVEGSEGAPPGEKVAAAETGGEQAAGGGAVEQ
ncbi:MAG: caspase family protein, partial [Propylenella sp.]